ncbi:MAG: T9SS type A sorting domain-containing protein [Bacteroidetes bacterium]|nr:T9SS type A sorting domain-containing protein [Bacteroidota bacterium]
MSLKITISILFFLFSGLQLFPQTPQHYYHIPGNVGVNNLFFNDGVCKKFIFIYTQSELASMTSGVNGALTFDSIYFRSNTSSSMSIANLEITIGHSTLSVPIPNFAANFNSGVPQVVLSVPLYVYNTLPGTWNVPADKWSGIPISTFNYNGTDNLVVQIRYTSCSYPDPFYADNGGVPIVQYADADTSSNASATTARPMFGFSSGILPPVALFNSVNHICPGTCTNFTNLSLNATSYIWTFPGASPDSSTSENPSNICYPTPGSYAVSLIASNSLGSDTITLNNYITVYPYPLPQGIMQVGDTLFANQGAVSYQWYYNGVVISGATDYFYLAPNGGDYNLVATDGNGCEVEAVIFDVVAGLTPALYEGEGVHLYPNPVKDKVKIQKSKVKSETAPQGVPRTVEISIYSVLGERVFSSFAEPNDPSQDITLDVSSLSSGLYLLEFNTGEKIIHFKFQKK